MPSNNYLPSDFAGHLGDTVRLGKVRKIGVLINKKDVELRPYVMPLPPLLVVGSAIDEFGEIVLPSFQSMRFLSLPLHRANASQMYCSVKLPLNAMQR
jgi:hypothetical protein